MRTNPVQLRGWGRAAGLSVMALVVAILGLVLVPGDVRAQGTFDPVFSAEVSDTEHNANADITTNFDIPDGDLQFAVLYTVVPPDFIPDSAVPLGALVGQINSASTVALFGGSCTTAIAPVFPLWTATTDDTGCTVKHSQQFADDDADGLQNAIECWPEFLSRMLPPGATPLERIYGETQVGASPVSENIVLLEAADVGLPADWGFVQISFLNDIGDPGRQARPMEALSDFCTPLSTEIITFGLSKDNTRTPDDDESGDVVRHNPPFGGTYTFHFKAVSMYNSDNDPIENYQDTCPLDVNTEASPHVETQSGGPDGDGIDASCDPAPTISCWNPRPANCAADYPYYAVDCDCDGFRNRLDTCPLVPNGCSDAACAGSWPMDPSWDEQADQDSDMIGDACELPGHETTPDGAQTTRDATADIVISGPAPGEETATPTPTPAATATGTATSTATATGTATATATATAIAGEGCAPVIPGTYNGLVRLNGVPAPAGYEVTANIGGTEWGTTIVSGGRYALDVPQRLPSSEPCFAGGTITFTIDGGTCTPTADWSSGLHDLDLACAPAATPTPPPTTVTVVPPTTTVVPTATPAKPPATGGGGLGGDQGLPLWAMVLAGWAGLMALAGLGTLATRITKR